MTPTVEVQPISSEDPKNGRGTAYPCGSFTLTTDINTITICLGNYI